MPLKRQRKGSHIPVREIERRSFHDKVHGLSQELENERERNKALGARIAIMEANAARLGCDPEEMYKPILKPARTTSQAGSARPDRITGANPKHPAINPATC